MRINLIFVLCHWWYKLSYKVYILVHKTIMLILMDIFNKSFSCSPLIHERNSPQTLSFIIYYFNRTLSWSSLADFRELYSKPRPLFGVELNLEQVVSWSWYSKQKIECSDKGRIRSSINSLSFILSRKHKTLFFHTIEKLEKWTPVARIFTKYGNKYCEKNDACRLIKNWSSL